MYDKIILVTRQTRLEGLIERFNTIRQARFYIEHGGGDFDFYVREHETYHKSRERLNQVLSKISKVQTFEREYLPNFIFAEDNLVVTIGIDGLVVNTAKYLDGQPLVAVNPDPANIDGVLLPFNWIQGAAAVKSLMEGSPIPITDISMAEVKLTDGQTLLAFNDFFIGVEDHRSARYQISARGITENHSSSGIIVSTGAGSTGWMSSVINMAGSIADYLNGDQDLTLNPFHMDWDTRALFFAVREPFISLTSSANIVCGWIQEDRPLVLESHMPSGGVIFSDGVFTDSLQFNSGAIATIGLAEKTTRLVVGQSHHRPSPTQSDVPKKKDKTKKTKKRRESKKQ